MSEIVFEQEESSITIEGTTASTIDFTETTGTLDNGQAIEISNSTTANIIEIPTVTVIAQNTNSVSTIHISTGDKGETGDTGPQGATGPAGADGADGVGMVAGGTVNQILVKQSSTDYDIGWEDLIIETGKPTDAYAICNTEDAGTYKYFGFENKDGAWYILRKTVATNIYLYVYGASNYSTGWTNRASHTYASYESTF